MRPDFSITNLHAGVDRDTLATFDLAMTFGPDLTLTIGGLSLTDRAGERHIVLPSFEADDPLRTGLRLAGSAVPDFVRDVRTKVEAAIDAGEMTSSLPRRINVEHAA